MVLDHLGNSIDLSSGPLRIVSLVPSQTELLHDLGLAEEVVGVTKFCVHPKSWLKEKTIVGGTKNFRFDVIDTLRPNLIIGNKEENYQEGIEKLKKKYPVWMSDIVSLEDALNMIQSVGAITGTELKATVICSQIRDGFESLPKRPSARTLYLIWRNPWMAAGKKTFVNTMLEAVGLENAIAADRYPELSDHDIQTISPEVILLSSEPYPFRDKHIVELKLIVPKSKILLVDGEYFSWYGSRLIKAPDYFQTLEF